MEGGNAFVGSFGYYVSYRGLSQKTSKRRYKEDGHAQCFCGNGERA
jgi:hypothetical protein